MDKLRKYIQECWGDIVYSDYDKVATLEDLEYNYRYIRFLLSTEAMFIKWLVENDKIDYDKIGEKIWMENHKAHFPVNKYWYVYDLELGDVSSADYSDYESLLMLLSISDTPIDDLILYLK